MATVVALTVDALAGRESGVGSASLGWTRSMLAARCRAWQRLTRRGVAVCCAVCAFCGGAWRHRPSYVFGAGGHMPDGRRVSCGGATERYRCAGACRGCREGAIKAGRCRVGVGTRRCVARRFGRVVGRRPFPVRLVGCAPLPFVVPAFGCGRGRSRKQSFDVRTRVDHPGGVDGQIGGCGAIFWSTVIDE
ncbi:hypothetical protein KCP70_05000 [Salmonella enterica subsp. enterica]|nr:hypothetical protein KCP70_05000 [Salmonella enterica subsp. enterica]